MILHLGYTLKLTVYCSFVCVRVLLCVLSVLFYFIISVFGRPFVKRFALCYRTVVPDMTYNVFSGTLNPTQSINLLDSYLSVLSCLSVLSATLVYCG